MWNSKIKVWVFVLVPFAALSQSKKIDYTKSTVSFTIKNAGLKVEGHFDQYAVQFNFDPQNLSATRIEAEFETTSINTGINGRDNHLRKEEFFYATKFPKIFFKITSLKKQSSDDYLLYGKLTIKDVTREVTMPMSIRKENGFEVYESKLVINRQDYHVGGNSWVMSDEVFITIKIRAQ